MSTGLDAQQRIFASNPDDRRAFEALEEHYFLEGDWSTLATIYQQRIAAPSIEGDPEQLAPLLFRLGQILEERVLDLHAASDVYWRLARIDPRNRPALRQLRGIHERAEQWDMVLQIAELEAATEMAPYERAEFEAEQGRYWLDHLDDADEALRAFERSLAADPDYPAALEGLARIHGDADRHAEAAECLERLTVRLRGPERAPFWVSLGMLQAGPLADPARARHCFEQALDDDPFSVAAVEWLLLLETADENWDAVALLLETRFDLASGARYRAAIAVEASQIQLNHLGSSAGARAWVERAAELAGDEIAVLLAQADVDRAEGDTEELLTTLERLIEIGGTRIPQTALIQAAELYADLERRDEAIEALRLAAEKTSGDDSAMLALQARLLRDAGAKRELAETLETLTSLDAFDDPRHKASALRELARLQEEDLGEAEGAESNWQRAFELDPSDDEALDALERIHRKARDWDMLRAILEAALETRGQVGQARLSATLGHLLLDGFEDPAGARVRFDAALDDDLTCSAALAGLRALAERSGDKDLLLRVCERQAVDCDDADELALLARTCVPILRERRAFDPALDWARRWHEMAPREIEALRWRAELEGELGRPEAEVVSRRALARLQKGPDRLDSLRRQAELHLELDDAVAAGAALELALELEPDDVDTLASLCDVYRRLGRADELARCLRKWAEAVPAGDGTAILEELACLLHDPLGDLDTAIVIRWRIIDQADAGPDAVEKLEALLELAGRYSEMAQLFDARRAELADDSPEALELDLRRGRLRLDALGQCEEAAEIFARLHERHPDDDAILDDLERALRAGDDARGLCELLEKRAGWVSDDERRLAMQFERATLMDEALGEPLAACDLYESIAREESGTGHADFALARLETLLESHGHWSRLRELLLSRVDDVEGDALATIRERIAQISRERLGDLATCAEQLEAIARTTTDRVHVWQRLEEIYRHELDRPRDWLRVVEAELETEPEPEREFALRVNAARLFLDADKRPSRREASEAYPHYERVLEIDPSHSEAAEELTRHYLSERDYVAVRRVLERRLEHLEPAAKDARADVHLRLAELLVDFLEEPTAALEHLEAARPVLGVIPRVADPLAEIYEAGGRHEELAALAREVLDGGDAPLEATHWRIRLAGSQRALGQLDEATLTYRAALRKAPGDREVEDALIEIYEEQGEFEPLADILERRLPYAQFEEIIDLRMRLARVHADGRDAPLEALEELEKVLELQPQHRDAFAFAIDVAERVGDPDRLVALIERALATEMPGAERAALLEQLGHLIADRIGNPEQSLPCFREAIALAPDRDSARRALREQLERLERWPAALDCLFVEASKATGDARIELLEQAATIAWDHVGPDAALPWVARLREERPEDPTLLARLGEIHRRAGRYEAVLSALDEEICMRPTERDACRLYVERARLLEREIRAPGRAIVAYQQALAAAANDEERDPILVELDRLYASTDRAVERAAILEQRVERESGEAVVELRQTLATLYCVDLVQPDLAIRHLLHNVDATRDDPREQMGHLAALDAALRASGRPESWCRVAERELFLIEQHDDIRASTPAEFQLFLREELGRIYDVELGNPDRALAHHRTVVDEHTDSERAEERLFELLRRCGHWTELAQRLGTRLEARDGSAEEWLELGRLREEHLHDLRGAVAAFEHASGQDATSREAFRGLRRCTERLGDDAALADVLERDLEREDDIDALQRAATAHKLGDVCWQRLRETERAATSYERALALDPTRLTSLQALVEIHEAGDDDEATYALYRRELEVLGHAEAHRERAREIWLRLAAGLHRDERSARASLEAYEAAARIAPLEASDELRLARLHESLGQAEPFSEIFGRWCDREDSTAGVLEHLELARHLADRGEVSQARQRARKATEVDASRPEAWVQLAEIERAAGRREAAADAFAEAANVADLRWAAEYCVEAAACLADRDLERCFRLLDQAIVHDAGCFDAQTAMVRTADALGRDGRTLDAALRVFDAPDSERLSDETRCELALLGARAATRCDEREAARRLFAIVVAADPDQVEALEGVAYADFEVGDYRAARTTLEHRVELAGDDPNRALHLRMIARGLEADGLLDAAWTRYEEALEVAADDVEAHAGLVRIHERAARPEEALQGLERWAACGGEAATCAQAALRAGEHALSIEDPARALRNLERATHLDPGLAPAWNLRCEVAAAHAPATEVRAMCERALDAIEAGPFSAKISLQAAKLAESAGDADTARERYADAVRWDPRCVEAALSESRLARRAGDWPQADRVLSGFVEQHPDPTSPTLAHVHLERGRLLSGPLEDFVEAIAAYERALDLQPELHVARTALAGLLMHAPGRESDALALHREILSRSPTNATSLRALIQLAEAGGQAEVVASARAILHALGQDAPDEVAEGERRLRFPIQARPPLDDEASERLRRVAEVLRDELGAVLSDVGDPTPPVDDPPLASALTLLAEAEAASTAPGLMRLGAEERAALFHSIAGLFLDVGGNGGDSPYREAVDRALTRWSRRKVRRIVEETSLEEIEAVDALAWTAEIRALGAAQVLDRNGGDLATVLRALLVVDGAASDPNRLDAATIGALVSSTESTRLFLGRLTSALCDRLASRR